MKLAYEDAKTSSPHEIVVSIEDLLIEILLRLPVKPLFRFKLVSKHWLFVISNERFQLSWNQKPNPAVGLIFPVQNSELMFPDLKSELIYFDKSSTNPITTNFINPPHPFTTVDSCNGLLLCKQKPYDLGYYRPQYRYYVCNPTTKEYVVLPPLARERNKCYQLCLAYDPSNSPHYKVVCITTTTHHENQFQVYSSRTRCWRKCGESIQANVSFARGVYWNGSIHWISLTNTRKSVFFNPDDEEKMLQAMPASPATSSGDSSMYYCGVSCGHLHYIEDRKAEMELSVYEMRRDYSEWIVKYRVDCSRLDDRLGSVVCVLVRGKRDADSFLVWQRRKRFVRHDLVGGAYETIFECEDAEVEQFISRAQSPLQLIESL